MKRTLSIKEQQKRLQESFDSDYVIENAAPNTMQYERTIREDKKFSIIDIKMMRQFRRPEKRLSQAKKEGLERLGGPSFFEKDRDKWMKRYEEANEKEAKQSGYVKKRRNSTMGFELKDEASIKLSSKRLPTLRTSLSPSTVDFKYKGNTRDIEHLIAHRIGGVNGNLSQINFETQLRNYPSNFKIEPAQEGSRNNKGQILDVYGNVRWLEPSLSKKSGTFPFLDQSQLLLSKKGSFAKITKLPSLQVPTPRNIDPKFNDKYREPNRNAIRHLLKPTKRNSQVLWETGLRNYNSEVHTSLVFLEKDSSRLL